MNKFYIGLGLFFSIIFMTACASNQKTIISDKIDVSTEIEKAIVSASESIIAKLPQNSKVVLFNSSTEETELTNHVIEEISSYLMGNSSLIILERNKFGILEIEQDWQLNSGYVPDEDQVSIAHRMEAQYVVSSYITGNNYLQRLRIKTWNLSTGETIVSSIYPVDGIGAQLVEKINENVNIPNDNQEDAPYITVRENGITIDYQKYSDVYNGDSRKYMYFEIYIDGTMFYYNLEYLSLENSETFRVALTNYEIKSIDDMNIQKQLANWNKTLNSFNFNSDVAPMITNNITETLSEYNDIDRRNINTISRILIREINNFN